MSNAAISGCSPAQDERLENCLLVRGLLSYRTQSRAFARQFGHSRLSLRCSRCCCSQVRMRSCCIHPEQRRHRRRGHSWPLANGRGSGERSTSRMAGLRGVRHARYMQGSGFRLPRRFDTSGTTTFDALGYWVAVSKVTPHEYASLTSLQLCTLPKVSQLQVPRCSPTDFVQPRRPARHVRYTRAPTPFRRH
jgi:hypothetical protein